MQISDDDLRTLVRETWAPAVGLGVDTDTRATGPLPAAADDVTTQVELTGAWTGTVTVAARRAAVASVASRMFDLPAEDLAEEDVDDAAREMANVIGGNVKPFAGGECDMSLPRGGDAVTTEGSPIAAIQFLVAGHEASVAVHAA